jgi:hypothetical protein
VTSAVLADPAALNTAQAHLAAAVAALLQPTTQPLARLRAVDPEVMATGEAVEQAHAERMAVLKARHAAYRARRDAAGMRRVLAALIERERGHQAAVAARQRGVADLPSLLDQLVDAVQSTQGGGGASSGVHRWTYGVDAAELLARMRATVAARTTAELPTRMRSWASLAGHWRTEDPQRLIDNAELAQHWVAQAREALNPPRRMTAVGACPECGTSIVYTRDDLGEIVRRPALEISVTSGWARCLAEGCTAEWPPERLPLLAAVLEQQASA